MMLYLLLQVKNGDISLAQACARTMLTPLVFLSDDGKFYCKEIDKRITPKVDPVSAACLKWLCLNATHLPSETDNLTDVLEYLRQNEPLTAEEFDVELCEHQRA